MITKADVLDKLHKERKDIKTLPSYIISYDKNTGIQNDLSEVVDFADGQRLIVRSSCTAEDGIDVSNAGRFESVLNVAPDAASIRNAVEEVYASYGDMAGNLEEILIQPMLTDIRKSGVVFTRDIYTGAPYYCIDYYEGVDSAAVTSGRKNEDRVVVAFKGRAIKAKMCVDEDVAALLRIVRSLEEYLSNDALDIEFGITETDDIYIFQVRPIAVRYERWNNMYEVESSLNRVYKKMEKLMRSHPFIAGSSTCFGVMPDWNPAEMLGARPKKLAVSLYKELITDIIWARQRDDYGYRNLTSSPLMVLFCGIPYIDTRITFNSFVPAMLSGELTEKLVNYYIDRLKTHPQYHDKIEFEIVFSCYYIGLPKILKNLVKYGFSEEECKCIADALLQITNKVIDPQNGLYKKDIEKIEKLKASHDKILNSDLSTVDKIYWLIEECKTNGTLPFAGVARAAFIAVQLLQSFVSEKLIDQQDYDRFMQGLNTVSRQMGQDRYHMTRQAFLEKYGHIRPGTYDIESARYDEAFEYYFEKTTFEKPCSQPLSDTGIHEFSPPKMSAIDDALKKNGFNVDARGILTFAKEAIEGREYLKFVFTKTVSEILRLIDAYGRRLGFSREDMAHLDIHEIKQLYSDLYSGNVIDIFEKNIWENKKQYELAKNIKLPSLISSPEEVYSFVMMDEEPNYITMGKITAEVVQEKDVHKMDISGKIVCIKAADPGYDFLFARELGGLITQFGGANSHMAIRCAELKVPAVIGAGENNYNLWSAQETLLLDAGNRQVKIIKGKDYHG